MRHRSRPVRQLRAITLAGAAGALLLGAGAPQGTQVSVTIEGVRNAKGVVRACLTDRQQGWPASCRQYRADAPAAASLKLTFRDIPPGHYAVALLHDENANGKADRVLGMMPKEGFGFSRDAKVKFGPPKFGDAAFDVGREPVSLTIRMRYMM